MSELEFLVNDLSLNGQFNSLPDFKLAIKRIMEIQRIARRFGHELYCHRNISNSEVCQGVSIQQAIPQTFGLDQRRAVMQWLNKNGPFWDDDQHHDSGDYFECNGQVVTDTAVGEAAYHCLHGAECHLVSLTLSKWEYTPIVVYFRLTDEENRQIDVCNHWEQQSVETVLQSAPAKLESWVQLEDWSRSRFSNIKFSVDCFDSIRGHPFVSGAAKQIDKLFYVLNEYQLLLSSSGKRTPEAHSFYRKYFMGDNSWFSDSSNTEKAKFRDNLTFQHPDEPSKKLLCTWHGKIRSGNEIRIHFSWPARADKHLYVVYVGPKITKK